MVRVNVEPADYYPIIDKLFTEGIVGALDALGLKAEGIDARLKPTGDDVRIDFSLEVSSEGNREVSSMRDFIRIAADRLVEEANERFSGMGNGRFILGELRLVEVNEMRERPSPSPSITVKSAPDEFKEPLEKVAKGLWIKLQERGVKVISVTINFEEAPKPRVLAHLSLDENLTFYEKKLLVEYISDKMEAYLWTTLGKKDYIIDIKLSTPSEERKGEKDPKEGIEDDDIKELLRNLSE